MPYDRDEHILGHAKRIAYGDTLIAISNDVFGTIDINLPERELESEELTNDDSPDFHKDYMPGLYEPGTVGFSYRYAKTMFTALEAVYQLATVAGTRADATKFWKVTLPDGSTAIFSGFLKAHNLPVEGATSPVVEAEIQVIGKITWAAGA